MIDSEPETCLSCYYITGTYIKDIDVVYIYQKDWFSQLSRYEGSEKSNQ